MIFDKQEIKIDHLSWSQIERFMNNPADWYYTYIKYPELKSDGDTWALKVGRQYHSAMEALYNNKSFVEVLEDFENLHTSNLSQARDKKKLIECIKNYHMNILPLYDTLVDTENIEKHVTDFMVEGVPVPIELRIDAFTLDDRIIDHKTVGGKKPRATNNGQGMLYSLWYYRTYNRLPRSFELHRAYKDTGLVDIDSASYELADVLNMERMIRFVYEAMKAGHFYWGFDGYDQRHKAEYDDEILYNS
jgi:hypothetical protein